MSRKVKSFLFVSLVALGAFLAVALATTHVQDWPFTRDASYRAVGNLSGPFGSLLAYLCIGFFGRLFAWFFPVALLVIAGGIAAGRSRGPRRMLFKTGLLLVLLNSFFALLDFTSGSEILSGAAGRAVAGVLSSLLGRIGGTIIIITCLLLVLLTEVRFLWRKSADLFGSRPDLRPVLGVIGRGLGRGLTAVARWGRDRVVDAARALAGGWTWIQRAREERRRARRERELEMADVGDEAVFPADDVAIDKQDRFVAGPEVPGQPEAETSPPVVEPAAANMPAKAAKKTPARRAKPVVIVDEADRRIPIEEAELPPLGILEGGNGVRSGFSSDKLRTWSAILEDKLSNYGIEGKVTAVKQGPLVTTFEFAPAPGVKIKDIVSRADDLALAMRARSLRLIAPIPGRAVVGIEIPNPDQDMVFLKDVLGEIPDRLRLSGLMIGLGVDAVGKAFNINLCSAPHLLMAGTTGSGKSVSLNCFLASLLFQYRPSDVRFILVDPKMVELSVYNGIPHLLHPVITDPREAVKVFNYLIKEMNRRNELLRKNGVKNIESYNSKIALGKSGPGAPPDAPDESDSRLPYIVLVVDELGDLVLTKGADIESLLSRLSNMARAVGIHMIVATQRPSVDVIVGKTKANFPTRIAFRVASKVDSRTILDCVGADKLLGKGDMLFVDAKHPEALRLHGPWISEDELEKLVAHWKQYAYDESRLDLIEEVAAGVQSDETDPYFDDAREIILHYRQGSTSLLQRKLHIGYARAARLLDQLEQAGVVGPPDGSKPREVLIREEAEVGVDLDDESI